MSCVSSRLNWFVMNQNHTAPLHFFIRFTEYTFIAFIDDGLMKRDASVKVQHANSTRDGNERALYNVAESLLALSIGIRNLNAQDFSTEYFEQANLRLEDTTLT